jgi:hypothetical protein
MMKTTLPALASLFAAISFLAAPASAQLTFGAIGDLSAQSINRSFVGDFGLPNSPSGIVPRYVTPEANPAVTRGATWTNLGPTSTCTALAFAPSLWGAQPGLLTPGTPLLIGPVVTAGNQDLCAAGVTLIVSCPVANACHVAPPFTVASTR